jgi:tetratricopeptide (TPR) repeat protein
MKRLHETSRVVLARGTLWLAALVLGWRVFTLEMADLLASSDPGAAVAWRGAHPAAQYAIAQAEFLARRDADALAHARRALAASPLDGRPYRIAAGIAERAGDVAAARALFALAERRAPRDLPTRIKQAAYALKDGDRARAIHEADELLRVQPEFDPQVVPRLVRLTVDPAAIDPIVQALSHEPAWRYRFLLTLATQGHDVRNATRIFESPAVAGSKAPEEAVLRRILRARILDPARAAGPAPIDVRTAAPADWYALMDWGPIERAAYTYSEDPYESVGMP